MTETELDQLSFRLFKTFSRCEYALKAAEFRTGNHNRVEADWTRFAGEVTGAFDEPADAKLTDAIDYLREYPPRKQVLSDGGLAWSDTPPDSENDADLLLAYVRRVRNNLFHGGKFNGRWLEPQRSEELLTHCLVVLEAAINAHPAVLEAYHH